MREQEKAAKRRRTDPRYADRWMVGSGIDIGCGDSPVSPLNFPKITAVLPWDMYVFGHGDAQYMTGVAPDTFDFVHSSHCLEHMFEPTVALSNWLKITKPGGFVLVTVPDELLYEHGRWPSQFNPDHKVSFTLREKPVLPRSINVLNMVRRMRNVELEQLSLLTDKFDWSATDSVDQTHLDAECSIEFVLRKT